MSRHSNRGQKKKPTAQDDFRKTFKAVKLPDDFKTEDDFLKHATTTFDADLSWDETNRRDAINDAEFAAGDQWEKFIKQHRIAAKKPTLTFNRLIAFIGQVVGGRRLNETVIKIAADDDAFKDTAKIRQALIRSIQKVSKAETAYNKAQENQVISGIGNFEVRLEYAHDDVFEQDAKVLPISNAFSVVWDRFLEEPTGDDAGHVFKVRSMSHADFKTEWPGKTVGDFSNDTQLLGYDLEDGWITRDKIRVVDYWRIRTRRRIVALLRDPEDGSEDVVDITNMNMDKFVDRLVSNDEGVPVMREVDRKYAELYTLTAMDILEGPYELPISRVPVFRVPAWEFHIGDKVTRFGLVRFLKDPQRLHNYWRSVIAEKLTLTPKGNWIASVESVEGREAEWRNSHVSDDPLLTYNGEAGQAPTRVPPAQIEAGLIEQAGMASQDLRDISNIHEANLGQRSNEVSGKAIVARQRIGDTGTTIYSDNLELAIEACGRVLNDLIPFVYNTARTIAVLGEEGEELPAQAINDTTNEKAVDITAGKYKVTSTTGPSTVTKRAEAAESMLNMVNAMPDTLAVAADKIIEAQDWPGSSEIARRLRDGMDPSLLDEKDLTDTQKQRLAQGQQQAQQQAQREEQIFQADLREKLAKADQAEGLAQQARANATKALASISTDELKIIADIDDQRINQILAAVDKFNSVTSTSNNENTGE